MSDYLVAEKNKIPLLLAPQLAVFLSQPGSATGNPTPLEEQLCPGGFGDCNHRRILQFSLHGDCTAWVALSLVFNYTLYQFSLWQFSGDSRLKSILGFNPSDSARQVALEFLTGYIIEKALSIDNIFLFGGKFPIGASLAIIGGIIAVSILLSLLIPKRSGSQPGAALYPSNSRIGISRPLSEKNLDNHQKVKKSGPHQQALR